ncbi:uncharacterized short protein YbdD (DUF466 family) [Sphingomonas jejuensis]|uniref:Uncharacterized short protein YbdD (DUF466 family) n=1 Tax=Sphingomonas jejuensis TaxID=904715 RepID=A0ABX0XPB9_9SPHN|nr:CstA-like transporter-associated (seleno)protein [Sphingomonas jejuensis]NJC35238.1 uncharacterized short protein YbdD (DUF466 family) [Sphingomonas jejuensis]
MSGLGWIAETARMMVGLPDYGTYLRHMAANHPDMPAMTRTEFFRDRQQARYGGKGGGRCC